VAAVLLLALLPKPPLYSGVTFSSAIVSRDGELLRLTLAADDRFRLRTPIEEIAPAAIDATLLYEDRHFQQHPGFNPFAIVRAGWSTYVSRKRSMGASTITMQLARIRFRIETRSVPGKLLQIAVRFSWNATTANRKSLRPT
jgi:penicillin-binding protein 1C